MIDIHCHLLPGIDDGSPSFEESIEIIKNAYNEGVTDIIVTPHFIYQSKFDTSVSKTKNIFNKLQKQLKEEKIPVNIYLGNEAFVEENLPELLEKNRFSSLNNSCYILFEMSRNNYYHGIYDLLFKLKSKGIIPILAHPERYTYLQRNPNEAIKLIEHGALFQLNADSYYGAYGDDTKKLFIKFIKHHCGSFIATDTHSLKRNKYGDLSKIRKDLLKYISASEIEELVTNNALKVINNEKQEKLNVVPFKKTILSKWK